MTVNARQYRSREQAPAPAKGITARAVVLGFLLAAVHTCWVVYEEVALGHMWVTSYMLFQSVLGILFLLLALNSTLKRFRPRWMLSPAELMVVFCMATVATSLASIDLMQNLLPNLMWVFQTPDRLETYGKYFSYIPPWFVPQDKELVDGYFAGSTDFWRFFRPDVFRPWLLPIVFWSGFMLVLALTTYCLGSILRRQWVDHEKLTFPIIELPLMMVRENTIGSLFHSRLMLGGFALSAVLLSVNFLSSIYPSLPTIQLNILKVSNVLQPPFSGMSPIIIAWWPFAIGLCYLMPLDVSFSCWFFYLAIRLSMVLGTMFGWREPTAGYSGWPHFQLMAQGAWIGLFFVVMRAARKHIAEVWRLAISNGESRDDAREPLSYRAAVFGAILGFILLAGTMIISGMRPHIAFIFFTIYLLSIVVMARIYAQVAVPIFELFFYQSADMMASVVGSKAMNYREMTLIANLHWTDRTYRYHLMGHQMESMAFAEKQGESMRKLTHALLIAAVTGIVVGMLTMFQVYYHRGASSAGMASMGQPWTGLEGWSKQLSWASAPKPPQLAGLATIGGSAGIVVGLAMARNAWFAFPLNPIGYAFASSYAMEYIWNIVLVTWLTKTLVLRYGGLGLYRKSLPLFFGIALGDAVTQFAWALVMSALGMSGASGYGPQRWSG